MSGAMDVLCLRLLDLAQAQHAALAGGDLEEAILLMEKRQRVVDEIQKIGRTAPTAGSLTAVAAVDEEIAALVRAEMGALSEEIVNIQKAKAFLGSASKAASVGALHRLT